MEYEINKRYPISELSNITEWWQTHREYDINEYSEERVFADKPITETVTRTITETDEETGEELSREISEEITVGHERVEQPPVDGLGNPREYNDYITITERTPDLIVQDRIYALKTELAKIKEDIEQVQYGLIRDDYEAKRVRACEIINELRVLEGKDPRSIRNA